MSAADKVTWFHVHGLLLRMFSLNPPQSGIAQKDLQGRHKSSKTDDRKVTITQLLKDKAKNYLLLFLETSSIHGLNHLVGAKRHPCEIFLWLTTLMLSVCGTVFISETTWSRYQSSPTVISMDRDMYAWNTTFPGVTICPSEKIDPVKLANYLNNSSEVDKEKLKDFITALANATYENFAALPKYDGIAPEKYLDTILSLAPAFTPNLVVGAAGVRMQMVPTITEMGICYAINSMIAVYNSPEYRKANRWDIIKTNNSSFTVHPLDGEMFAQALNLNSSFDVYIHDTSEVADISSKRHHSPAYFYMKLHVTATTVYTAPEAASLNVIQRRCRFKHENNLKHNAVYSYTMCRIECRIQLCIKYCKCIPYYYRKIGDEKICDVKGLQCLHEFRELLLDLRYKSGKKVDCECFPICDDVNYVVQSYTLQSWVLGTNFQWGMVTYPRMRYRRDVIFGFTDVLVAVGGMAGLFLGCSVLSFMEIVYFLTLRLICHNNNTLNK